MLDEFHLRSIHADLCLALLREVREARPELRLVVMSATLDAQPVAAVEPPHPFECMASVVSHQNVRALGAIFLREMPPSASVVSGSTTTGR